jgi:hypothetical protein
MAVQAHPQQGSPRPTSHPLHRDAVVGHAVSMAESQPCDSRGYARLVATPARFGAGLTEAEVRRFQTIELLSLVEMLLQSRGVFEQPREDSLEFALPRS